MYKKIFILIVLLLLMTSFNNFVISSEIEKINLEKTYELMKRNDVDFKLVKLKLDNLILETKENKINNLLVNSKIEEKKIELNFEKTKNNYLNEKNQRLIYIAEKYFKLLELKKEKNIKEKEILYESELLETIKAEENNLNNSIVISENIKSDYKQELREFKYILGINQSINIELENKIEYEIDKKLNEINYNKNINDKEEIKLIKQEIKILEDEIKKAEIKEIAQIKISELKNNLQIKKLQKEKLIWELTNNLRRQHYLYKKAVNNLKMRKNNLKTVKENHFLLNQQYKKGMIKKIDLLNSELNLLKEKANYEKSIYNYHLNLLKLRNILGENLGAGFNV